MATSLKGVEKGRRISVWRYRWWGDNALRFTFPNIYSISSKKEDGNPTGSEVTGMGVSLGDKV